MKNPSTYWPTEKISNSSPSSLHAPVNLKPGPFPEPSDISSILQAEKLRSCLLLLSVGFFFFLLFFLRNGYEGMPLFSDIATHFHIYTIISISLSSQVVMGMNGGQDLNV